MKDETKELLDWKIKDSFILDEMKQKCFKFNGWQYKSKKSKERFRVLCLLEDYANAYYDLKEEIKSANESITWWTNRYNVLYEENENLKQQLDFIEEQNKYINKLEKLLREKGLYKYTPEKGFRLVGDDSE